MTTLSQTSFASFYPQVYIIVTHSNSIFFPVQRNWSQASSASQSSESVAPSLCRFVALDPQPFSVSLHWSLHHWEKSFQYLPPSPVFPCQLDVLSCFRPSSLPIAFKCGWVLSLFHLDIDSFEPTGFFAQEKSNIEILFASFIVAAVSYAGSPFNTSSPSTSWSCCFSCLFETISVRFSHLKSPCSLSLKVGSWPRQNDRKNERNDSLIVMKPETKKENEELRKKSQIRINEIMDGMTSTQMKWRSRWEEVEMKWTIVSIIANHGFSRFAGLCICFTLTRGSDFQNRWRHEEQQQHVQLRQSLGSQHVEEVELAYVMK